MCNESNTTLEYDKIIDILAGCAVTGRGRDLCKSLVPVSDLDEVRQRQADTDDMVRFIMEHRNIPLSGIQDIRSGVGRARAEAMLSTKELLDIASFLRAVERVVSAVPKDLVMAYGDSGDGMGERMIVTRVRQLELLAALEKSIDSCIASEEEIRDRASMELYGIRRKIRKAQEDVKRVLEQIVKSRSTALQENLITVRNDRYVIPVKAEHRGQVQGLVHDRSSSGSTVFIEPLAVVELNNKLRELELEEQKEIERILRTLSSGVASNADALLLDAVILAELDFVQAKANLAIKMKAMPPHINNKGYIKLKKARHPLIKAQDVVPIDFIIGDDFTSLIITGPNTGGKTVSLKTAGLLTLMAMAGLQIPAADGSEISVFNHILADIGDEQSIEQNLSTFSAHLKQIIRILSKSDDKSLVLLDELGSGTDPSEGATLAMAILENLHARGSVIVATTHYKELKGYALNTDGVENACCEFDTNTLSPTYRLMIGVPGVSNAFAISRRLGLPDGIIARAEDLISDEGARFEALVESIEKSHREAKRIEEEIEAMRRESDLVKADLERERASILSQKHELISEAKEEAAALYTKAEEDVQSLMDELRREMSPRGGHQLESKAKGQLRQAKSELLGERQGLGGAGMQGTGKISADDIVVGAHYEAASLGLVGVVRTKPDNRGNVILQCGAKSITVPVTALSAAPAGASQVERGKGRKTRVKTDNSGDLSSAIKASMATEINLIGMRVAEAERALDSFIDNAVLTGFSPIRIVHGKGTGALRKAVTDILARDKRVGYFRLGGQGEGGDGVTIAELK